MEVLERSSLPRSALPPLVKPLLLPCLEAILKGSEAQAPGQAPAKASAAHGLAWALLGALRLHLVLPPASSDPAGKYALKRAHLMRIVDTEIAAEVQVGALP